MEIDVEAVDELSVDAPEFVLYGGKGGVGKTTMAAATALASAMAGKETLVVSTDPAHSLSDTFDRPVPPIPTAIHDDYPLFGVEIDPETALDETALFDDEGGMAGMLGGLDELLGGADDGDRGTAMPGMDEAAAMQQLLFLLDDDRFDRVVVDTAPTGHTLRLLELPETMDSMVGRLLTIRERLSGMVENLAGLLGDEDPEEDLGDLRTLSDRIERLRSTLRDPSRTDFRIVFVPEVMSVRESKRLRDRLDGFGIPVGTVVVNRVMEPLAAVSDGAVEPAVVSPDLDSCPFCQHRWEVQQTALAEAQGLFRGNDVRRVPLLAEEVRGERVLRVVAACLA